MKKCIDKAAIGNILHKLWKKDTGFENIDIVQIAYNRALQDVQCEIDTIEVQEEPVSEDLEKAAKQYSFYIPTQCEATETWKKETEQHFIDGAKWKEQQMMKDAVDACVTGIRTYKEENEVDFTVMYEKGIIPYEIEQEVKLIIIKED